MIKSVLPKIALVCFVSIVTWNVTSQIKAQYGGRPGKSSVAATTIATDSAPVQLVTGSKSVATMADMNQLNLLTNNRKPIAARSLDTLTLEADGNSVIVHARAKLFETRPGYTFLWSVRVLSSKRKVIVPRHIYRDHAIEPVLGGDMTPEFADVIPLLPGNYLIEISMHEMNPNLPFDQHQFEEVDPNKIGSNQCFRMAKAIQIQ